MGLRDDRGTAERFSNRYISLAVDAFEKSRISEGQLAAFLRCDRVAARETVEQFLTTTYLAADGRLERFQVDSGTSLLQSGSLPEQPRAIDSDG